MGIHLQMRRLVDALPICRDVIVRASQAELAITLERLSEPQ
jgi:hypothetical protein